MLDKNEIVKGLKTLGVKRGMALEVHSSLKSFGYVKGGALTVIDSLIECVGNDGSIVMPSFRISKPMELSQEDIKNKLSLKLKILESNNTEPSGMGAIADEFRKREDVLTGEGLFRVSAWGKDKKKNSEGFQNLIECGGWALLIGVDIYSLSSMHYVEEFLPQRIKAIFQADKRLLEIYPENEWYIETGVPPIKAWYKIQDRAYRNGSINETIIGRSKCMLFKINDIVGIYKKWLQEDPFGLYEIIK